MRHERGVGVRGVQAGEVEIPAMAAEAGRETRQGAQRAMRRATDATWHKISSAYGYATQHKHTPNQVIKINAY